MKPNHTPTPWHVIDQSPIEGISFGGLELKSVATQAEPGVKLVVAEMLTREDAAFIVRSANSHDALVAGLKQIAGVIEAIKVGDLDKHDLIAYLEEGSTFRAALALAKGESA